MKTRKLLFLFMLFASTSSVWAAFPTILGNGTLANPYKITTAAELLQVRDSVNTFASPTSNLAYYELSNNIDMSAADWTIPIGVTGRFFKGTFNGNGFKITGITLGSSTTPHLSQALFGIVGPATIKNLEIDVNFTIVRTGATGNNYVAGLVNTISAGVTQINNCRVTGSISQTNSAGATNATQKVGGIVAQTGAETYITNCSADLLITNTITSGTATNCINIAGGIVADANVAVKSGIVNCYSTGTLSASNAAGAVSVGGILGVRNGTTNTPLCEILNCYSAMTISAAQSINTNSGTGGIAGSQNNASPNFVKNCIALNPSITYRTSSTTPNLKRVAIKNNYVGNLANNYALSSMTTTAYTAWNFSNQTGTLATINPSYGAGLADGEVLAGADATAQIADGLLKLNAYVTSNPSYAGIATTTFSPVMLNTWSAGVTYPVNSPTPLTFSSSATDASIVGSSANVILTGNGTTLSIANDKTVDNITLNTGSKLNFTATKTLTITGDLLLKADQTNSFSANIGTGTLAVSGAIKYLKTIDDQKWYFISLPTDVTIANITGAPALGTLGTDWFIKYYDGAKRGISGSGSNWISITAADVTTDPTLKLNKYQGYIIGLKTGNPLTELSFPLVKAEVSTESADRSISVAANEGAAAVTNHGWNLIGQPYLSNYVGNNAVGAFNIYVSDGTSTYTAYTKATVPDMKPMSAYFIQASNALAGTGVSFSMAGRQAVKSLVANQLTDEVKLNLTSQTGTDYALLTMDTNLSADYEIGYDLEKWVGTGTDKPQLYTQLNGINYAFNALPMSSVSNLPIGIYTKNSGSMTLSANALNASGLTKLLLTDNVTQPATVTDLLLSDYNFTADAGTNNSRFAISAQGVSTAIVRNTDKGEPTLIINKTQLTIRNMDTNSVVQIFDAMGRMIENRLAKNNSVEIALPFTGVYTVKINKGTNNWNKKLVVQN